MADATAAETSEPELILAARRRAIKLLHRPTEGVIAFTCNRVAVSSLRASGEVGTIASDYRIDSCSINEFASKSGPSPLIARAVKFLRYLCAAFVRIDRRNVEQRADIDGVIARGLVPHPSLKVVTSRDVTLLWLLNDRDDDSRPPASHAGNSRADTLNLYRQLQSALYERFAACGAVIDETDAANLVRLPATDVEWIETRPERRYTLSALFSGLGLREPKRRRKRESRSTRSQKSAARQKTYTDLNLSRLALLYGLPTEQGRDGFSGRQRGYAVRLLAATLRRLGMDSTEVDCAVESFNSDHCRPPLSRGTLRSLANFRTTMFKVTDQRINNWFDVTLSEALKYRLRKPSRFKTDAELIGTSCDRDSRRAALRTMHAVKGVWPTVRAAAAELTSRGFRNASPSTISRDIAALKGRQIP